MPYYYRNDGILIWINTHETCHIGHPHVHASYGGDDVSIDLDGHVMKGKIKRQAQIVAIQWVLKNKKMLREEWRRIHHV